MGSGVSTISSDSEVTEAAARDWASREKIPFDDLIFRRVQNGEANETRFKQMIPPQIPKWDQIALCLRSERVACQQEDGETPSIQIGLNETLPIVEDQIANIGPEDGCEDRVFELSTPNILKFSKPFIMPTAGYTVACWFKPSNDLWKSNDMNNNHTCTGYKLLCNSSSSTTTSSSSCLSLIKNENDNVYLGLCLNNQTFLISDHAKPLIPNVWQLIIMTCEPNISDIKLKKKSIHHKFEFHIAKDGFGPKFSGSLNLNILSNNASNSTNVTNASNIDPIEFCHQIDCIGVEATSHQNSLNLGFLSSLYIWNLKLEKKSLKQIFYAETWRFGIEVKSMRNILFERAQFLMSKLRLTFVGKAKVNKEEEKEQVREDTSQQRRNNDQLDDEDDVSIFQLIENLSEWQPIDNSHATISDGNGNDNGGGGGGSGGCSDKQHGDQYGVGDFSNADLTDEELKALLLICPSMGHLTVIKLSHNKKLTLNSLGAPLLDFLAENVPGNVESIELCGLEFTSLDMHDHHGQDNMKEEEKMNEEMDINKNNFEEKIVIATEEIRVYRGVSIDLSGSTGISEKTLQLLVNKGDAADKAKLARKEEIELSEQQVNAYEEMQSQLVQMWSDLEVGILPRPISSLPGNIQLLPSSNIINDCLNESVSNERTIILNGDIVTLTEMFEDSFYEGGKYKGKKKKGSSDREGKTKVSENIQEKFRKITKPFLCQRRKGLDGLSTNTLKTQNETTSENDVNNIFYQELKTFVEENLNSGGGSEAKYDDKDVNSGFEALCNFITFYENHLMKIEEARVRSLHEVIAFKYLEAHPEVVEKVIACFVNSNTKHPEPPDDLAVPLKAFVDIEGPKLSEPSLENLKSELCRYPSVPLVWKAAGDAKKQQIYAENQRLRKERQGKLRQFSLSQHDGGTKEARTSLFKSKRGSGMIIAHFSALSGHLKGLLKPMDFGLDLVKAKPSELHDEIANGRVEITSASGHSFGKQALHLELRSTSSMPCQVIIKKGTIFEHTNWVNKQNLLVIATTTVTANPTPTLYKIDAHCMNVTCACSSGENMLLSNWCFKRARVSDSQGAIWSWFEKSFSQGKRKESETVPVEGQAEE